MCQCLSVKYKLTLTISTIVFLFLSLTVILNDYSTRVNLRAESEGDMERFSNQVANAVDQYDRIRLAYEVEIIEKLRYASYLSASMIPKNRSEITDAALARTAEQMSLAHVSMISFDGAQWTIEESSSRSLRGKPVDLNVVPEGLMLHVESNGDSSSQAGGSFYLSDWPNDRLEADRDKRLWGYLQLPDRDYMLAVGIDVEQEISLLERGGPQAIIRDITGLHPEILEMTVIKDGEVQFGDYRYEDGSVEGTVDKALTQDKIMYREHRAGERRMSISYKTYGEADRYIVRAVTNLDYLHAELRKNRLNHVVIYATVLIFVILTSYWLSGVLIRPVRSILGKVNEVAAGVFDTPLEVKHKDELGQLAERINAMAKNLDVYTNKLKGAFEENRSMNEYLESIINHTPDAIHIEELDGTIVRVNHAFEIMFGWTQDEAVGQRLRLVPERYMQEEKQAFDAMMAGTLQPARETVRVRKDGTWLDVSVTTSPIRDKNGIIRAFASITRDMTSKNKMDELLRQAEKLNTVGQLAAGVAHEIRNPLTTLRGFVQLQQQTQKLNVRHSDLMLSELDRINLIVSEFLILAKPQATKFEIKDVRFVLGDVLSLLDSQAHLCDVMFQTSFTAEPCEVACEENQLKQVFINVLKNGIEAMPDGGTILIRVQRPEVDRIVVAIIDEGIGIPEEMIPKLGDPFFTGKDSGTGLGIMVSQRIIQSHQGTMNIRSTVGEGTEVTLTLPAIVD
jgi:two-component system, sporulation sensor kinase E